MSIEEKYYCLFDCYKFVNRKIALERADGAVRTGMLAWRG
jgi:hypothetical protein